MLKYKEYLLSRGVYNEDYTYDVDQLTYLCKVSIRREHWSRVLFFIGKGVEEGYILEVLIGDQAPLYLFKDFYRKYRGSSIRLGLYFESSVGVSPLQFSMIYGNLDTVIFFCVTKEDIEECQNLLETRICEYSTSKRLWVTLTRELYDRLHVLPAQE